MIQLKPLTKKFKTKNNHYIYDAYSNKIFKTNPIIYDIFDDILEPENIIIKKHKAKWNPSLIKNELVSVKPILKSIRLGDVSCTIDFKGINYNDLEKLYDNKLKQLTLETTQECNLRCTYCGFSGTYKTFRQHGSKKMSIDIAKKAVDFFVGKMDGNSKFGPIIGFYGGEPLLNWKLIVNTVAHANSLIHEKLNFHVTTNGTLLNQAKLEFLIKNDFFLSISLDGPEQLHDRYRKDIVGNGTFGRVYKNINLIRKLYPDYFEKRVNFMCVVAPPVNLDLINDFFSNELRLNDIRGKVIASSIDEYQTSFFDKYNIKKDYSHIKSNLEKYFDDLLNEKDQSMENIMRSTFEKWFDIVHRREKKVLPEIYPPQGACIPGQRRLFVNTEGNFFMCEKVNSNYKIGDIHNGFSMTSIRKFFHKYVEFFKNCNRCWALRLCRKCFNEIRNGEEFCEQRRDELCWNKKSHLETLLIKYCEIREKKHDAFKVLEKIVYY